MNGPAQHRATGLKQMPRHSGSLLALGLTAERLVLWLLPLRLRQSWRAAASIARRRRGRA